jgi:D-alanine transaminase
VSIQDRGFLFADSVYEVCEVRDGALIDAARHLDRLDRSLGELRMSPPMSRAALLRIMVETVRRNRVTYGLVYLQVTRGAAPRDFGFPARVRPALVVTARMSDRAARDRQAECGVAVITVPDQRWARRDIKTTGLLPNVLAKQAAREQGAFEAWMLDDDGCVTEGASSNAWIVTADGAVVTRPANHDILRGITRTTLLEVIAAEKLRLEERPFALPEALNAREAFLSSATTIVMPVVRIDGHPVADGRPGPVSLALRHRFHSIAASGPAIATRAGHG